MAEKDETVPAVLKHAPKVMGMVAKTHEQLVAMGDDGSVTALANRIHSLFAGVPIGKAMLALWVALVDLCLDIEKAGEKAEGAKLN